MTEPLGVAFIEIQPVAAGFRTKTEAQLRTQLAGLSAGVPPSPATAAATGQMQLFTTATTQATAAQVALTEAETAGAAAANQKAAAEARAASATSTHAATARAAAGAFGAQATALTGVGAGAGGLSVPLAAAAAGAVILFKSLQQADRFKAQMDLLQASTDATGDEMAEAARQAVALGRDLNLPLTTAVEAAEAINLLSRSGFDLRDSMTASRGALLLTAASGQELATSVGQIDQVLDAFNLTAEDSVRVADAIAAGLRFTGGAADEAAGALSTLAPIADTLGLSLEDTLTLVLQLTESGLPAGAAVGGLRQSLLRLASGAPAVAKGLKEIGLTVKDLRDEAGNLRPDAFVLLANALQKVNRERQIQLLTEIFSRRSALAVIRLIDQQRDGYERMREAAHAVGTAQKDADARTKSFGGTLNETKDNAADFGNQLGQIVDGPAILFVGILGDIVRQAALAAEGVNIVAGAVGFLGEELAEAIPFANELLDVLVKMSEAQRDPAGTVLGFLGSLPGHAKDAVAGMKTAIANNVAGLRDVPGIREFVDHLDELIGAIEKSGPEAERGMKRMTEAVKNGIGDMEKEMENAVPRIESLSTQLAVAVATGASDQTQLTILRRIQAKREADLARKRKRFREGKVSEETVTNAANSLAEVNRAIDAAMGRIAADSAAAASKARAAADEAERNATERDRQFLRAVQSQLADREEAVQVAAATENTVQDDLVANRKLRDFLTRTIAALKARIADTRAAGHDTEALANELASLRRGRRAVIREIKGLRADAAEQANATRIENAELDLQILEARVGTGDPTRAQTNQLVAAHLKVIAALKRAQSLTKTRSIEWKRLQLEIEQEQAAIRDLRNTQSEGSGDPAAFAKQAFQFLTTLQGFSSNLATNLLLPGGAPPLSGPSAPGGTAATGGAPGRTMPSPFAPRRPATRDDLTPRGVTTGQGNVQIDLLRKILRQMEVANASSTHPEAKNQRAWGASAGDTAYQGSQGM